MHPEAPRIQRASPEERVILGTCARCYNSSASTIRMRVALTVVMQEGPAMFVLFLALTILSLLVLIVGLIWLLVAQGRTTRRSGRDVGAEIMTGMGSDDDEAIPLVEKSVFAGTSTQVTWDVDVSFGDIKGMMEGSTVARGAARTAGDGRALRLDRVWRSGAVGEDG